MKNYITLFFLISALQFSFSQDIESNDETDEIIDYLLGLEDIDLVEAIADLENYHLLMLSSEFNSDSYFLGRDIGIDQYNFVTQVMYENHLGIFAGVSGTYYSKFDPKWDVTVLTAGYGIDFGKQENFRTELGYNRYIFSDSNSNDFKNSLDLAVYYGTNDNSFETAINTSYFFGDKTGFQSSLSLYGNLTLFDLNTENGSTLDFEPNLSFILGSENIDTSRIDNLGINSAFLNSVVDSFETFGLRNIQLRLPIVFNFDQLAAEIGFNINFPKAFDFENDIDNTSFFNIGINYIFDIR